MEASPASCHPRRACDFFDLFVLSASNQLLSNPKQSCHPERSASQIYRKQGLYGAESKDPGDARWQMLLGAFRPRTAKDNKKSQPPSEPFPTHHKNVILSEALRRYIAKRGLHSAESKDLGGACWQMLLGAFRPQTTPEDKKSQTPSEAEGPAVPRTFPGNVFDPSEVGEICGLVQPETEAYFRRLALH